MRVTLGFDTSCYTTSAAAVDEHGAVVAAERMLLLSGRDSAAFARARPFLRMCGKCPR